jgi:hypothetical protein
MAVFSSDGPDGVLLAEQCARKLPDAAVISPHDPGMPNVDFELDEKSLALLQPYAPVKGRQGSLVCGTLVGEFVFRRNFRRRGGEVAEGNGFGGGGSWQYAFVLQSVLEMHGCS